MVVDSAPGKGTRISRQFPIPGYASSRRLVPFKKVTTRIGMASISTIIPTPKEQRNISSWDEGRLQAQL